jgi:hypothetical protein
VVTVSRSGGARATAATLTAAAAEEEGREKAAVVTAPLTRISVNGAARLGSARDGSGGVHR